MKDGEDMRFLGVLPDGGLQDAFQQPKWDENFERWTLVEVLPDGSSAQLRTFLPFIWGYANWDQALAAYDAGQIRNINDMPRSWK
jgi:hypothetical protein